jgi:hypothetical protein
VYSCSHLCPLPSLFLPPSAPPPPLSLFPPRQVFESLGIENKFGVQQLALIKTRFADDTPVMTAMLRFQEHCQITCWKVMGAPVAGREEVRSYTTLIHYTHTLHPYTTLIHYTHTLHSYARRWIE